jgi:hypothetical protein
VRWSKAGVFDRIFQTLAADSTATGTLMIDRTHLKAYRTAASLLDSDTFVFPLSAGRGRARGGLDSKLHAVCDGKSLLLVLGLPRE